MQPASGGAIQTGIADDDVLRPIKLHAILRTHDNRASIHALAHVVVGFSKETQHDTIGKESTKTLPRTPVQGQIDGTCGQALIPVGVSYDTRNASSYVPTDVVNLVFESNLALALKRVLGVIDNTIIQ